MDLPKDFTDLMRQQYGDEMAENLFEGLSAEPCVSIRLNPKKSPLICPEGETREGGINGDRLHLLNEATAVPWCPDAFYLSERPAFTFDPLFHAGVYYVQEASSMYLAEVLRKWLPQTQKRGEQSGGTQQSSLPLQGAGTAASECGSALDLCAAPGGKSTLLRSLLPDDCLLVSNEPMPKRAQVLAENMTKWGHPNSIVTQNYPADFTFLSDMFDLIVTDVPCSGEGMFRKDEGAIRDWSVENVDTCWRRQRSILTDIWPTLKPGGLLVYSTCTFNHFEDEDNVAWIAEHLGAEVLEQRHFFPGRDAGEGFFIAALRKRKEGVGEGNGKASESVQSLLRGKIQRNMNVLLNGVPKPEKTPKGVVPSHVLAMSTNLWNPETPEAVEASAYPRYELTYDEALAYLRREALRIEAPRGIVLVTFKGVPLGFVKSVGNRANNLYPQEWRIRTTYTTPFCLLSGREE